MPGLARDLAFVLARLGGRGCKAGAQGVPAEFFGREAGMTDMPLYDQSDAGVGEPAIGDSAVSQDWTEESGWMSLSFLSRSPATRPITLLRAWLD